MQIARTHLNVYCHNPQHPAHADLLAYPSDSVRYTCEAHVIRQGVPRRGWASRLVASCKQVVANNPYTRLLMRKMRRVPVPTDNGASLDLVHSCGTWANFPRGVSWTADVEHAGALFNYSPRNMANGLWRRVVSSLLKCEECRGLIMWSHSAKRSVSATFNDAEIDNKVFVSHPTCGPLAPSPRLSPSEQSRPLVLFVGRGYWGKGGFLLVRALAQLNSKAFRAVFVTDATEEDLAASRSGPNVEFVHTNLTRADLLAQYFRKASVFCMPSLSDTYGYVLIEAMASGLPVIAARTRGAAPELVAQRKTGFLITPPAEIFDARDQYRCSFPTFCEELKRVDATASVTELADYLDEILSNHSLRQSMREAAYDQFIGDGWLSLATRARVMEHLYMRMTQSV